MISYNFNVALLIDKVTAKKNSLGINWIRVSHRMGISPNSIKYLLARCKRQRALGGTKSLYNSIDVKLIPYLLDFTNTKFEDYLLKEETE